MEALHVIVSFSFNFFYESKFSLLMHIRSKACDKLDVEDKMRLVITKTRPCISKLAPDKQQQKLHLSLFPL